MTIIKISKNYLISEDQESITFNLSDNSLKEEQELYLEQRNLESKSQELTDEDNPWIKYAGMFKDDPQYRDFLAEIVSYRQELEQHIEQNNETLS